MSAGELDDRRIQRIFEQRIRPTVTGVRRDRPTVLVVAGQPGWAWKARTCTTPMS